MEEMLQFAKNKWFMEFSFRFEVRLPAQGSAAAVAQERDCCDVLVVARCPCSPLTYATHTLVPLQNCTVTKKDDRAGRQKCTVAVNSNGVYILEAARGQAWQGDTPLFTAPFGLFAQVKAAERVKEGCVFDLTTVQDGSTTYTLTVSGHVH